VDAADPLGEMGAIRVCRAIRIVLTDLGIHFDKCDGFLVFELTRSRGLMALHWLDAQHNLWAVVKRFLMPLGSEPGAAPDQVVGDLFLS
jgi:hypothetical protein